MPALQDGEKSTDLHIQERCRALQPAIRALILQKKVDAFVGNREGRLPDDLPLIKGFIKMTGDSKDARQLYVEMLQAHSTLLDEAERNTDKGAELFNAFTQDIAGRLKYRPGMNFQAAQRSVLRSEVTLFFFLSRELPLEKINLAANQSYLFLNVPILAETISKNTPAVEPFKKLFIAWFEKEPQPHLMQRALYVAVEAKMKEALPILMKFILNKEIHVTARAQAALLLVKNGSTEHLKEIEPLLEDKTLVGNFNINNQKGQVQMRDVGLAVSIKLSGQKMSDYSFDVMTGADEMIAMSYVYCAFSDDAKREASHKKYQEFKAKQAKK